MLLAVLFLSKEVIKMSENVNAIYQNTIQCYENLASTFKTLTHNNILELLNICLIKLNQLLDTETPENSTNFIALFNLNQQATLYITQIKKIMNSQNRNPIKLLKSPSPPLNDDCENVKLRNAVKNMEVTPRTKGLCDIAGLEHVKNILQTYIISPINQPQLYNNVKVSNCILFFGPPGTGKTRLADAIAVAANATLLSVTASSILSHYVGQSEKMLRSLFQFIENNDKQTILFIDEVDGLCRQRIEGESEHSRRLKNEFMCQISNFEDSRKGYVICATNCPWELDVAFLRRFQKRIFVPLPDFNERYNFLKLYTTNTSLQDTSDLWEPILSRTEGFSGYDMVQLVQHALTIPIIQLQGNKVWKLVDNEFYERFSSFDSLGENCSIHFCDFVRLPPNSVKGRKAEFADLLAALNEVKRTVSEEDAKKYEDYVIEH